MRYYLAMVTKGLIAAAGRGTRFLPVVKSYPKELVAILEKPNIQYLVEELIGAGVNEIAIVHRHGDSSIKRYFTPDKELEDYLKKNNKKEFLNSLREIWKKAKVLRFIPQGRSLPYGNASPILAAKGFLKNDPFVFMFGDDLILEPVAGGYVKKLINLYEEYSPGIVLGAQEVPWSEINRYASIEYVKDKKYPNRAVQVLEKLEKDKAPSNIAQIGRFVVSSKIFSVLAKQGLSRDNELWFADAVNTLAKDDVAIAQPVENGRWMTTGDPLRWLKANIDFALAREDLKGEIKEFMSQKLKVSKN